MSVSSTSSSQKQSTHVNSDDKASADGAADSDAGSNSEEEVHHKKKGWHALQDSFLVDRKLALKVGRCDTVTHTFFHGWLTEG